MSSTQASVTPQAPAPRQAPPASATVKAHYKDDPIGYLLEAGWRAVGGLWLDPTLPEKDEWSFETVYCQRPIQNPQTRAISYERVAVQVKDADGRTVDAQQKCCKPAGTPISQDAAVATQRMRDAEAAHLNH